MLKVRREWVNETKANTYKLPEDCKGFYEKKDADTPLSPDEEGKEEEGDAKGKGDKKKGGDKKEGKGKGKKKKGDAGGEAEIYKISLTEAVQKFDEIYEDFANDWGDRDERENYKQGHDVEMAKEEIMPVLEDEYKQMVDEMIKMELDNMRALQGGKAGKKKKGGKKKKKGGKKKKKKLPKLPGFKAIGGFDADPKELLSQLIQNNIVKRLPSAKISDFIGEFNYIHSMMEDPNKQMFE